MAFLKNFNIGRISLLLRALAFIPSGINHLGEGHPSVWVTVTCNAFLGKMAFFKNFNISHISLGFRFSFPYLMDNLPRRGAIPCMVIVMLECILGEKWLFLKK